MIDQLKNLSFDKILLPAGIATAAVLVLGLISVLSVKRDRHDVIARHWLSRLLYTLFLVTVAILAATSFGSIVSEGHMEHYALLAHVAVAGAFVFLLLAVAITHLPIGTSSKLNWWWEKWSVWGLVASGILVSVTMFLSMLPLLGTSELIQALQVHRYAGLATVIFSSLHLFSLIVGRLGWR